MTTDLTLPAGPVHFVGIGGVGMAGLARLLHQQGVPVSGSDRSGNRLTAELAERGIPVALGHARSNLPAEVHWAVRTPAVPSMNPELELLHSRHLPVFARGDVLAALANTRNTVAVAGAHGKTTTSAMLLHVLRTCGVRAGYAIGGETSFAGRVADRGDPEAPFVVEADESDGTLVRYRPRVGVITHVEWDHVERFATRGALMACYRRFAEQAGALWIREEDTDAAEVSRDLPDVRTLGSSEAADLQVTGIASSQQGVQFRIQGAACTVPLPGTHNAWNAAMAIAAASDCGVDVDAAAVALSTYAGVGRRFQRQVVRGVTVIQDYAHHPTELNAVLDSVRALRPARVWVAFQPHRFSRTRHLLRDFADALSCVDHLALIPVYAAFERPEQGAGSDVLAEVCRSAHPEVQVWEDRGALIAMWAEQVEEGDVLLIAGAGDVESLFTEVVEGWCGE